MGTHKERLKIFENVLARTSGGKDTLTEFARAMSSLNGLQTMSEINPPMANLGTQGGVPPTPPMEIPPAGEVGLNGLQNAP